MESQCLECGDMLNLPTELEMGEVLDCEHCGVELEVKSITPPMLMLFEEEEK